VRFNDDNVADRLGFLGRMFHGSDKKGWLGALKSWLGEKATSAADWME
jgi:hypothetical protein